VDRLGLELSQKMSEKEENSDDEVQVMDGYVIEGRKKQ
jgi:hypothetical protein